MMGDGRMRLLENVGSSDTSAGLRENYTEKVFSREEYTKLMAIGGKAGSARVDQFSIE